MLGASTAAFATPFAIGYALHANRSTPGRRLGRIALVLSAAEAIVCLALAGAWLWKRLT